jgi:hypothetical protein
MVVAMTHASAALEAMRRTPWQRFGGNVQTKLQGTGM